MKYLPGFQIFFLSPFPKDLIKIFISQQAVET